MRRLVLLLAVLVCGSLCAYAGSTDFTGSFDSSGIQENQPFTFLTWIGGNWQNGYPYFINQNNGPRVIDVVMCDDYFHGGSPGDRWSANITNMGTDPLTSVRFNEIEPDEQDIAKLYHEAGWILLQTQDTSPQDWKEMNYAVWTLFDHSALCDAECMNWLSLANTAYLDGFPNTDFNKVYIVTPVNQHDPDPNGMQEFLAIGRDPLGGKDGSAQTTPEPGPFVLLGTGVLTLFRKKIFS